MSVPYCRMVKCVRRLYSSTSRKYMRSDDIRQIFLDYFVKDHGHKFVRSSPVIPLCDPTVAFVNAGMNQFKSVFLGKMQPPSQRVVNSQKCIRVGGKHNDLSVVGKDGYHHTFFEMLGNWSFGDYFKKDACTMAWELLTGPYQIDPSRLYVTYFGGDKNLNLPPDDECRHIWRSIGVSEDRILAFGSSDNFWEMGASGPCGPCTEIHIDHLPDSDPRSRAKFVNAGRSDLTELWNLVFIEYNRSIDGTLSSLPNKHIDTGMGMERLTAILQGKSNNYETDLFLPIFEVIQKASNVRPYCHEFDPNNSNYELDTAYRILADHSRMITACLADGMLPEQNHKLRRVIRKSMLIASKLFRNNNLLHETIPEVAEILGTTYPEMKLRLLDVLQIISFEYQTLAALRKSFSADMEKIMSQNKHLEEVDFFESPGFVPAYKELQIVKDKFSGNTMPGDFAFKLRDTYGLNEDAIDKLAEVENLQVDHKEFYEELAKARDRSKETFSKAATMDRNSQEISSFTASLKSTDNFYKYNYTYNADKKIYEVPVIKAKILGILVSGEPVDSVDMRCSGPISIITDKSNFYYESGGQQCDYGSIVKNVNSSNAHFCIKNVSSNNGCLLHSGSFIDSSGDDQILCVSDEIELHVDAIRRTNNTLHHTATHLLNASVRFLTKCVTYQLSSIVSADYLKLELGILGPKIDKSILEQIECLIRGVIKNKVPTNVKIISIQDVLNAKDIVMVPGEIYPETGLRLLSIEDSNSGLCSKELCCGTHALNSSELQDFCFTNFKQTGRCKYTFVAIAGNKAIEAHERISEIVSTISSYEPLINTEQQPTDTLEARLTRLRNEVSNADSDLPFSSKLECLEKINTLIKQLKEASKLMLKEFVDIEMRNLLQRHPKKKTPFIVHFLVCSTMMEDVSLQKATKFCQDRPILVASFTNGVVKARCCVPKDKTDHFSAEEWMKVFASVFEAQTSPPKGQDAREVCNMKAKKMPSGLFHEQLEVAINDAKKFASSYL